MASLDYTLRNINIPASDEYTSCESTEYLLNPENDRLTIYPIKNKLIWDTYKKQQAAYWTAEEIDFSKDYKDFCSLNENEQYFIKLAELNKLHGLKELSMGMSSDYHLALTNGATYIRIGSAIFS